MAEPNWKEFCSKILNIAHEGDIDTDQVYNIGVETGCVQIVECTVPCVPDDNDMIQCGCAEYCEHGEVVDCHRLADSPNTRALDERVQELIAYTYEAARESEGHIGEPTYHDENCSEDAAYHKLMLIKITNLFPENLTDELHDYLYPSLIGKRP